jgi:hypothetical protein
MELNYEIFETEIVVFAPEVNGADWSMDRNGDGSYLARYSAKGGIKSFYMKPATAEEKALIEDADETTLIRWAHAEIERRIAQHAALVDEDIAIAVHNYVVEAHNENVECCGGSWEMDSYEIYEFHVGDAVRAARRNDEVDDLPEPHQSLAMLETEKF